VSFGAFLSLAGNGSTSTAGDTHRLRGLFCNAEHQIDETLGRMRTLPPRAAVEFTNRAAVVCTFVDQIDYVVERPVILGEIPGAVPLIKYEAMLIAVVVGNQVREVTPPARVFFAIPQRLGGAQRESRV
jgi:hypothetical protein